MKLIVINGSAESGKDTFIELFQGRYHAGNFSTIDPIKSAMLVLGWNGIKDDHNRRMMVELKQLWIKYNSNACVDYVEKVCDDNWCKYDIMFVHCREPEEITKIVNRIANTTTLLIKSNRGKPLDNGADNIVDGYNYDYIITNDGSLDELKNKAIEFGKYNI